MKFELLPLPGLAIAHSTARMDHRGAFMRMFCATSLLPILGNRQIAQINHSRTIEKGAVRGMHFQKAPHAEMKLIRCLKGAVYDVAVDIRPESATYLRHYSIELAAGDGKLFVIPEGFAHGFQTLTADTELLYLHTHHYEPQSEDGLLFDDPVLAISWPLPVSDISERDRQHSRILIAPHITRPTTTN
jgi:dTDP-4-dehydrorhamnose 3,5-epimerase